MIRKHREFVSLCALAFISSATYTHAGFMFTGAPTVAQEPTATGGTGMIVPPFPDVIPTSNPNGMKYTNGVIKYTFGNDPSGTKVTINFRLERPYEITGSTDSFKKAGGSVQGDVTVTRNDPSDPHIAVTNVALNFRASYSDTIAGEVANSSKSWSDEDSMIGSADSGPTNFGGTLTRVTGETSPGRLTAGSTGVLVGEGMIMFETPTPTQPGAMITFNFPNSFDIIEGIPEPSSLSLATLVLLGVVYRSRR